MSDEKQRTSEERNELIKKELDNPNGFIWSVAKKKGYHNAIRDWNFMDRDDLIQEGWVALLQAGDNYNEDFNKDFAWYAFYWVNQRLGMVVNNNIDKNKHETSWEKEYEIEDEEEPSSRFDKIVNQLSDEEQEIIQLSIEGYTTREIADKIGEISHMTVARRLANL